MEEERLLPMVSREFSFYSFNNVNVMCYGATPSKSAFLCSGIGVVGSGQYSTCTVVEQYPIIPLLAEAGHGPRGSWTCISKKHLMNQT